MKNQTARRAHRWHVHSLRPRQHIVPVLGRPAESAACAPSHRPSSRSRSAIAAAKPAHRGQRRSPRDGCAAADRTSPAARTQRRPGRHAVQLRRRQRGFDAFGDAQRVSGKGREIQGTARPPGFGRTGIQRHQSHRAAGVAVELAQQLARRIACDLRARIGQECTCNVIRMPSTSITGAISAAKRPTRCPSRQYSAPTWARNAWPEGSGHSRR